MWSDYELTSHTWISSIRNVIKSTPIGVTSYSEETIILLEEIKQQLRAPLATISEVTLTDNDSLLPVVTCSDVIFHNIEFVNAECTKNLRQYNIIEYQGIV